MILRDCLFNYVTVIAADLEQPPWIMDQQVVGPHTSVQGDRLVGLKPMFTISGQTVTLTASSRDRARCRVASFEVAPGLLSCLRAGDTLRVARSGVGGVSLSVSRDHRTLLAVGAASRFPLESLVVSVGPDPFLEEPLPVEACSPTPFWSPKRWLPKHHDEPSKHVVLFGPRVLRNTARTPACPWPRPETWIEVCAGGARAIVREQEEATVGEYTVFVERSYRDGLPGLDESVAIFPSGDTLRDVVIASAKRLASRNVRSLRWPSEQPKKLFSVRRQGVMCDAEIFYGNDYVDCRYVRDGEVVLSQRFECDQDAEQWILSEREKCLRDGTGGPLYALE
jgi:hypothetical protein